MSCWQHKVQAVSSESFLHVQIERATAFMLNLKDTCSQIRFLYGAHGLSRTYFLLSLRDTYVCTNEDHTELDCESTDIVEEKLVGKLDMEIECRYFAS